MTRRRAHYVLSSHWDREWYLPFQAFRHKLCRLLDQILPALEDGRLVGPYTTDGQVIVLDDYLEIYPERREQIQRLAREGKLILGPWYVLPDEFLVSGESLVRNLRLGRWIARSYGTQPSNAGFVCDLFGHISQLPQILAGFGIHTGLIWRGTNSPHAKLVRWRGADGSEMLCYRFGLNGYCRYAGEMRMSSSPGSPFEPLAKRDPQVLAANLESLIEREAAEVPHGPILLFDGADHQGWDPEAYAVLRQRMNDTTGGIDVIHSTLDAYLQELAACGDHIHETLEGELREPGLHSIEQDTQWLIPGVLSSRAPLKQANARCQTLLCHWAEPLGVIAHTTLGQAYPTGFLDVAWRWLLQNYPHDSICGCSIDAVHQDMIYRFNQCEQIATQVTDESLTKLAAHIEGEIQGDELRVVVFNPLPYAFDQSIELTLPIPTSWPEYPTHMGAVREVMFHVHDDAGSEIAVQKLSQKWNRTRFRIHDARFPEPFPVHEVRISLPVSIPAMGYTTLRVRKGDPAHHARIKTTRAMATSSHTMENEFLHVTIQPEGTLSILDKRSGATYDRLLTYEDSADTGDGWYNSQPIGDQIHFAGAGQVSIALIHDGPYLTTFRIRTVMSLPAAFESGDSWQRSDRMEQLTIDSEVSLRPRQPRVEVKVRIHNTIDDHRLRVLLPSGAQGAVTYQADSAFDVVERPIAMRQDNHLYREPEVETRPQQTWTAVSNGRQGLAVISTGQYESAVRDQPMRPIALTLYRSTRKTVLTDGEPDGQLRQPLSFEFWIQPLNGEIDSAALCHLGQQLGAGVKSSMLFAKDAALHRSSDMRLPARASFLQVEGQVVFTSLSQFEGQTELRLFNPTAQPQTVALRWPMDTPGLRPYTRCQPVDFEGRPTGPAIPVTNGQASVTLEAKKILTLRLEAKA